MEPMYKPKFKPYVRSWVETYSYARVQTETFSSVRASALASSRASVHAKLHCIHQLLPLENIRAAHDPEAPAAANYIWLSQDYLNTQLASTSCVLLYFES